MTSVKGLQKQLECELTSAVEELAISHDSVEHMKEQMQKLMMERDVMVHCGKKYEDMSMHHQRWKLADFRSPAEGALWFAESFGLIPESLQVYTHTQSKNAYLFIMQRHTIYSSTVHVYVIVA